MLHNTGPLEGEPTRYLWIPSQKASDVIMKHFHILIYGYLYIWFWRYNG